MKIMGEKNRRHLLNMLTCSLYQSCQLTQQYSCYLLIASYSRYLYIFECPSSS